jgi:hypothetical protein
MPRRPIGNVAMSNAERSRRRRIKAKALCDAAQKPIQSAPTQPASPAVKAGNTGSADYPRMLYHPDGRTMIAATPEHHDHLMADGWGMVPLAVHQQRPVSHHGTLGTDNPFASPWRGW